MLSNLYAETYLTSIVIGGLSSIVIGSNGIDPSSSPTSGDENVTTKASTVTMYYAY